MDKKEINKPCTVVHKFAQDNNMLSIVEGHHSLRWWMDQLKKMQSYTLKNNTLLSIINQLYRSY